MRRESGSSRTGKEARPFCQGSKRVVFFCLMAVFFPITLITVPLLMRFVFLGSALYHLAPSDMRILDQKISTVWCQSEFVKMNTTFTAYLTTGEPKLIQNEKPLSITKNLIIPDDQKEFWGFYLLKGSTFRINTCAKSKGASLLIVKGREDLEYCAYTGEQDSMGNSDEFYDSESEEYEQMRKQAMSVRVNGSKVKNNHKFSEERAILLSHIKGHIKNPVEFEKLKLIFNEWMDTQKNGTINETQSTSTSSTQQPNIDDPLNTNESENLVRKKRSDTPNFGPDDIGHLIKRKIRRKRHTFEVRREDSGEINGAFEDKDDNNLDDKTNNSNSNEQLKGVWKDQHNLHEGIFNFSMANDGSDSESESSFSSSEEALAKCRGVISLIYLKPEDQCGPTFEGLNSTFEYKVNSSAYYYIIFGSENEIVDNFIKANFELDKTEYVLPEPLENCTNVDYCQTDLQFGSGEKLVVSVPKPSPERDDIWDKIYVAETDCGPRTCLYFIFALSVPIIIIMFAFQ